MFIAGTSTCTLVQNEFAISTFIDTSNNPKTNISVVNLCRLIRLYAALQYMFLNLWQIFAYSLFGLVIK